MQLTKLIIFINLLLRKTLNWVVIERALSFSFCCLSLIPAYCHFSSCFLPSLLSLHINLILSSSISHQSLSFSFIPNLFLISIVLITLPNSVFPFLLCYPSTHLHFFFSSKPLCCVCSLCFSVFTCNGCFNKTSPWCFYWCLAALES